jgi:hypothetical protein
MGNYNGTIRCGYCYDRGHNSRTCPTKLERMEKRFESAKESGEHVEYYANAVARMTGVNPETGDHKVRRNESRGRQCSYCKDYGHNRATCPTLKKDLARYSVMTREAREEVRAWAIEDGIGIGAMVKYKEYYSHESAVLMMVEAINLQTTHARQRYYQVTLRPLSGIGRKQTVSVQSPQHRADNGDSRYGSTLQVAGPLTPEQMASQIDEEWVYADIDWKNPPEGLSSNVFEKGKSRVFHFWHDHD